MAKDLTPREGTDVALSKSKSFMGIIKNIFNNKVVIDDDSWMQRLWNWADENDIDDRNWVEDETFTEGGYWLGLSRRKESLLGATTLNLEYYDLVNIPKEIGKIINLSELYLSSNQLKYLPKEIGDLTNLKILLASYNQLVELPKEIGNLNKLVRLLLANNKLTKLPGEISKLINLTVIYANENQLKELPRGLGSLINLTQLEFSDNQLVGLPEEIGNLVNLEIFYLYGNLLEELPKEIGNLRELKLLGLSENKITKLPKEIGNLASLEELLVEECPLIELPKEIYKLTNLKLLALAGSCLVHLPKEIGSLISLEELRLTRNNLEELPKEIGNLVGLEKLYLADNQLVGLPQEIENLTNLIELSFANNKDLILTDTQKVWIKNLKNNGCNVYIDNNLMEKSLAKNEIEDKNIFVFDNGRSIFGIPGRKSIIIESLYAIIHNFSDKKLCIQKVFNDIENVETDIYYSIIGQMHLEYSGSKIDVENVKIIFEKEGSIGVCNSGIKVKPSSYIELRFDFYQKDIYFEAILFENNIRTKLYSKTLKNGPSELFDMYQMYIENSYEEAFKILDYKKKENDNNITKNKYSNKEILGTSYNMIREVFEESNGNKPISNNASFFTWDETISVLKEDNGKALIKLDDGTGYAIAYDTDKIIFIIKEIDGSPAFVNQQFYQKFYQEIYKNKNV